jgi:oxygen-independent coproporphyrinogen-3 oxidase
MNFQSNKSTSNSGLYIHIPFCRSKCPYCGFYSIASFTLIPRWLQAIKQEILLYQDQFIPFDTIYMGGGTPSILDLRDLEELINHLVSHFCFTSDPEITLEANPGEMTPEKIVGLKSLGFNRINLGVQSFNDQELLFLDRRHSAQVAKKAFEDLRKAGFNNIGIDLIYGLANQTMHSWESTLKQVLRLKPEHISCYQLTIEDKTPFQTMCRKGRLKTLDEESERHLFITGSDLLKQSGYIHYEISNFAQEQALVSRHNCKYWDHTPYLGLGPSAHSFQDSRRWWNKRSVRQYCDSLEQGKTPVAGFEELTPEQFDLETLFLGLRTHRGFDIRDLIEIPLIHTTLSRLQESGHIKVNHHRITATQKGFLVADHLPFYFM